MDPIIIFFIIYYIINIVYVVATIGKEREPITPGVAAGVVVIFLIFIYLLTRIG